MAYDATHKVDMNGLLLEVGQVKSANVTSITVLTDNSGGTADSTVAAIPAATAASTDTSAASLTSTNAAITAIKNDIADLTAKINAILGALG